MDSSDEKVLPAKLGIRDLNCKNHWKELNLNEAKITKPTVLCLGGNRSLGERDANAFCKSAEKLLNFEQLFGVIERSQIDFIGVSYGKFKNNKYCSFNGIETSHLTDSEIKTIAESLFYPLFKDKNGNRLDKQTAIKNFNLLTIFSHSYGAIAVNNIINCVYNEMINLGFTYDDTREIFSQIISVSYAPRGTIIGASNIQIISGCDGYDVPMNTNKKTRNVYFSRFQNVTTKEKQGNGAMKSDENTISVFTTNMTNNPKTNDHMLKVLTKMGSPEVDSSINAPNIFTLAQNLLILSVQNSLKNYNSTTFKPKPNIEQLLFNTKFILGKKQIDIEKEL